MPFLNKPPIRLVAFDLDDSLLRDDLTVSEADRAAIEKARKKGVMIVPASGRTLGTMKGTLTEINHVGPVISLNGARVAEYPSMEPIYERPVPLELSIEVVRLAKELGAYLQTYTGEDFEYETPCAFSELYTTFARDQGLVVGDLETHLRRVGIPSRKLLFIETDREKMAALRARVMDRFAKKLSIFHSKPMYLELTNPEASKGLALAALSKKYGIQPEEIMAIGDGENDIPMLTYAGIGVAVANAGQSVREKADYITLSNMDGGVGAAIRKFVLEGNANDPI